MKEFLIGLLAFGSISVFASDFCTISDVQGTYPNGSPETLVVLDCTDYQLHNDIYSKYSTYRSGNMPHFNSIAKSKIINDILGAGYKNVGCGSYKKN